MRVLFADRFPESQLAQLRERGCECELRPELASEELPGALGGFDVLVVRSTKVTSAALECSDLRLVVRAGAGTNTIDVASASKRGVYVCNVPGKNAIAVAELAFGLLLAIDRNIPDNVSDLRAGRWDKARYQRASGLQGRHVGIVGVGAIGVELAERVAAFGMSVHAIDRPGRDEDSRARLDAIGAIYHADLAALVSVCDVLSFHVPALSETRHLLDAELLAEIQPGTIILNTARGEIVDEAALLAVIDEKDLRVGLDVYADEPASSQGTFESALAQHPRVYGTHHIGASTEQAQRAIANEVVRILMAFQAGAVRNSVNLDPLRGSSTLVVRHDNQVGVLASVLLALRSAGINVEQMENRIFSGGHAAAATIQISGEVSPSVQAEIEAHEAVIGTSIERRT
jgi:D-3-phosphoglycerate dehydrogenase